MIRTIAKRAHRMSPIHEKIALAYYNKGVTPEEAMSLLASVKYIIANVAVDGITIANILRGMYLLKQQQQAVKPAPKRRAKTKAEPKT